MKISYETGERVYEFDLSSPIDISIPLHLNKEQPNLFGAERASSRVCESETLVGDTRRGGSCNFEEYTLIPHCNGTHTECVGHITHERISVRDALCDAFVPSTLVTIQPQSPAQSSDSYSVALQESDSLITKTSLEGALKNCDSNFLQGLIVRTLPNDESKLSRRYTAAPFFSLEAMKFIVELGVRHLVVDLPSIDRLSDEGKLANHRLFWNVEAGSFEQKNDARRNCTITELTFVPSAIKDGNYFLNIQIAPFESDASPSRPIIFRFEN